MGYGKEGMETQAWTDERIKWLEENRRKFAGQGQRTFRKAFDEKFGKPYPEFYGYVDAYYEMNRTNDDGKFGDRPDESNHPFNRMRRIHDMVAEGRVDEAYKEFQDYAKETGIPQLSLEEFKKRTGAKRNEMTHLKSKELYTQGKKEEAYKVAQQDEGWLGANFAEWSKWMDKVIQDSATSLNATPETYPGEAAEMLKFFEDKLAKATTEEQKRFYQEHVDRAKKFVAEVKNAIPRPMRLAEDRASAGQEAFGSKKNAIPSGGSENLPAEGYMYRGHSMKREGNYVRVDGLDDIFLKIEDARKAIDDLESGNY